MFEIGSSLREARLRRGFDLSQVERATRIRGKYVMALEEDRFDELPGDAYAKGFLRTYADFLGLDAQQFVDEYTSRFGAEDELAPPVPVRVRRGRRWDWRWLAVPAALAVAVIAWAALSGSSGHHTVPLATTQAAPTVTIHRAAKHAVKTARFVLVAARGPCWISVHRGSSNGLRLYEATLTEGQTIRFTAGQLWMRIGAPWNVVATLNGRRITLPNVTSNLLVTRTRATLTP